MTNEESIQLKKLLDKAIVENRSLTEEEKAKVESNGSLPKTVLDNSGYYYLITNIEKSDILINNTSDIEQFLKLVNN